MEDNSFSFDLSASAPAMQFEPLHEGPAKIKVIGVGGGGGNAVNHMYRQGIHGVEFIVCNTDAKALEASPVPNKIVLGTLGAGNVPERARQLALAHKDEIRQAISDDTQMLFITAGMGGGTGTGAAPIIAEIAKSIELEDEMVKHILVVAIVTEPFSFEGKRRREQAQTGIDELKKYVDAILVINNDKLRKFGNVSLKEAFSQADDVLLTAAKGIAEIITVSAYVNIDFRDVNTVMENSGTALMGAGEGHGENRAIQAIEGATTSVLLNDNDIRGAQNILLYFSCSPDHQITMDELGEVTDYLTDLTGNNGANIIWGIGDDDSLSDELRITLIATGFEPLPGPVVHVLPKENTTPDPEPTNTKPVEPSGEDRTEPKDIHEAPVDESGIHMIHKTTVENNSTQMPVTPQSVIQETKVLQDDSRNITINNTSKQDADPFGSVEVSMVDGKRRLTLDDGLEVVKNEPVVATVEPQEPSKSPSYLDEIRVFKREPVAPKEQKFETNTQKPVDSFFGQTSEPVAIVEEKPRPSYSESGRQPDNTSYVDKQIESVFKPQTMEQKVHDRAERIRLMNELLRNDPDGPRKVEEMTTDELTTDPIFHTTHSSESDAARTSVNASGTMSSRMSFLDNLPD